MRFFRTFPIAIPLLLFTAACTVAGGTVERPEGPEVVRLEDTRPSSGEETAAARLFIDARAAFDAGDVETAARLAGEVVENHPGSAVSVDALWLRAQAFESLGDRNLQSLDDAERLLAVLPADDRRLTPATLLRSRRLAELGRVREALVAVARLPLASEPSDAFAQWMAEALPRLSADGALEVANAVDPVSSITITLLTGAGRVLRDAGRIEEAAEVGGRAIRAGAEGDDLIVARALAESRPLPGEEPERFVLAAILPKSGSPSMRGVADRIEAGILAAIEAAGLGETVELVVLDDGGDPQASAALVQAAERQGAVAILGPTGSESLFAAASARRTRTPLISPTAFEVPSGADAVYSLSAFDPDAAEALAGWGRGGSLGRVAIVHAAYGASAEEARAFADAYRAQGGQVVGLVPFEPGLTYFETQIEQAVGLGPQTLLLPVPPEDVVALAPQVTFFGLDTLGIRIAGTAGWTDDQVRAEVAPRHLTGVLAASPARPAEGTLGDARFREAYERRFRRTLVEGSIEALGYDAASLILEAVRAGARSSAAVEGALERLPAFAGATGALTVRDGRVRRSHSVVCMDRGALLPSAAGDLPVLQYRPYPRDPETDSIPEGPGRMAGFLCPQVASADSVVGR